MSLQVLADQYGMSTEEAAKAKAELNSMLKIYSRAELLAELDRLEEKNSTSNLNGKERYFLQVLDSKLNSYW